MRIKIAVDRGGTFTDVVSYELLLTSPSSLRFIKFRAEGTRSNPALILHSTLTILNHTNKLSLNCSQPTRTTAMHPRKE